MPERSPELAICLAILSAMDTGQRADVIAALRQLRGQPTGGNEAQCALNLLEGRL